MASPSNVNIFPKTMEGGEKLSSIIGMPNHKKMRRIVPRTDDFFDGHFLVKGVD